MTTLKDILTDLINDTIKRTFVSDFENGEIEITEDDKEELVEDYIEIIKERLIG